MCVCVCVCVCVQVIDNLGPLELILNTPSHHRVHHGTASPPSSPPSFPPPSSFSSSPLLLYSLTSMPYTMCLSAHHHGVLCPSSFLFLSSSLTYSLSHTIQSLPASLPLPIHYVSLCPSSWCTIYVLPLSCSSPPPLPTLSLIPYSLSQLPYLSPYTMCLSAHHHGVLYMSFLFLVPLLLPYLLSLSYHTVSPSFLTSPHTLCVSLPIIMVYYVLPLSFLFLSSSLTYSLSHTIQSLPASLPLPIHYVSLCPSSWCTIYVLPLSCSSPPPLPTLSLSHHALCPSSFSSSLTYSLSHTMRYVPPPTTRKKPLLY